MTHRFFRPAHPLWYIACDGGLLHLAILSFWPHLVPYDYLGVYGQCTKHLAFQWHNALVGIFSLAVLAHAVETMLARRLCHELDLDLDDTHRWIVQTFLLGYPSLGILRRYAARKRRQT